LAKSCRRPSVACKPQKGNGDPASAGSPFRFPRMSRDGLSAIQLRRQVARYLHAGLRLLNCRLVPLTHYWLSSVAGFRLKRRTSCDRGLYSTGWPRKALPTIWAPPVIISIVFPYTKHKRPLSTIVTLRQLRYLEAPSETLHFGQAAETCPSARSGLPGARPLCVRRTFRPSRHCSRT
jgi:hypothetical protein